MNRVQVLIFSFYREEPQIIEELQPILHCVISRSWGAIRFECLDKKHLEQVSKLISYLRVPLAELAMAKQIILRAPGFLQTTFQIDVFSNTDSMV